MGIALATLAESMPQFALLLVLTLLPLQLVSGPANSSVSSQAGSRKWDRRPFRRWTPSVLGLPPLALPAPTKDPLKTSTAAAPDDRPWPAGDSRGPCRRGADVPGRLRGRKAEGQSEDDGAHVALESGTGATCGVSSSSFPKFESYQAALSSL